MTSSRPPRELLVGKAPTDVPLSLQRIAKAASVVDRIWVGPDEAKKLTDDERRSHALARDILAHICIDAPLKHASGHPGGPLSSLTFSYALLRRRNPHQDAALRMSAGHLSLLAYCLQYLGGRAPHDERLSSPQAIIDSFRTVGGLPGHVQAGIGDIPLGTGLLGKGVSSGLGHALGWKLRKKPGITDVLMGDGDTQEGQIMEAARLAATLQVDTLVVHADMNDLQISGPPSTIVAADVAAIFQSFGWAVVEVQNGNDPAQVEAALDIADTLVGNGRPILLCYYTTMGHGIAAMEEAANAGLPHYHGSPMKAELAADARSKLPSLDTLVQDYAPYRAALAERCAGMPPACEPLPAVRRAPRTVTDKNGGMRKDLGAVHIKNLMKADPRIIVLHADLAESGGFVEVLKEFPDRVINGGVAEANMYMMASGMRQAGLIPVTYTFAAFGTNEARANARLIDINCGHIPCGVFHDCTHTGLSVGEDGETAQDRNYLNLPFDNTHVWMPADSNQAGAMAERGLDLVADGMQSVFVFSPRSTHPQLKTPAGELIYGAEYVYDGKIDCIRGAGDCTDDVTILAIGACVHDAVTAADTLAAREEPVRVRVLNVSCIRPIDAAAIMQAALETRHLVVVEDHHSEGGLATQVADLIADFQLPCSLRRLGVNQYFPSAPAEQLKFLAGLDVDSIIDAVEDEVRTEVSGGEDLLATALFTLPHHSMHSRFRASLAPYIERLRTERGYLEALREYWRSKAAPAERLPTNDHIRQLLGDVPDVGDEM